MDLLKILPNANYGYLMVCMKAVLHVQWFCVGILHHRACLSSVLSVCVLGTDWLFSSINTKALVSLPRWLFCCRQAKSWKQLPAIWLSLLLPHSHPLKPRVPGGSREANLLFLYCQYLNLGFFSSVNTWKTWPFFFSSSEWNIRLCCSTHTSHTIFCMSEEELGCNITHNFYL